MPQIQLFDGTTLDFPEGTKPEIMDAVAKRETQSRQQPQVPATEPTGGGFAPRDVREAEPSRDQMKDAYQEQFRGIRERQNPVARYADTAMRGLGRVVPFMGDAAALGDYLTGGSQSFQEAKDKQEAMDAVDDTDRPVTSIGSQLVGGLALPGGGALRTGSLITRIGKGAAIGAGYGALYGAGQGTDMDERAGHAISGGIVGGIAGGAVPAVTAAAGTAASGARRLAEPYLGARNPEASAMGRVRDAIGRDAANGAERLDPADFARAQAEGQAPMVVDTGGESTRALLRSSANTNPESREQAASTMADRFRSQSERTGQLFDDLSATGLNPEELQQRLRDAARRENASRYDRAYQEANALVERGDLVRNRIGSGGPNDGFWTPELDRLSQSDLVRDAIQRSMSTSTNEAAVQGGRAVRSPSPFEEAADGSLRLAQPGPDGQRVLPRLEFWDQVQRNLRDVYDAASRSGDNNLERQASTIRRQLTDHLDTIVPSYHEARAGAARFFGADDALEAGQNFFRVNGRQDFSEAQRALAQMSPAERQLFREGFLADASHAARGTADNSNITGRAWLNSPRGRQKLGLALGTNDANTIDAYMLRERIMDRARTALGNSTTARQLAELGMAGGVGTGIQGLLTGDWNPLNGPGAIAGAAARFGHGRLMRGIDQRVSREVMQILTSQDPAVLNRVIQQSQAPQALVAALRQIESGLSRSGSGAAARVRNDQDTHNDIDIDGHAAGGSVHHDFANELLGEVAQRFGAGGVVEGAAKGALDIIKRLKAGVAVPELAERYPAQIDPVQKMDEQMSGILKPGMTIPKYYGPAQEALTNFADSQGVDPRFAQEVMWAGAKKLKDGAKYTPKPMIQIGNEAIERTRRITGLSADQVVDGIVKGTIPVYKRGGLASCKARSS